MKMWHEDMAAMHSKFGVPSAIDQFDDEKFKKFLKFRIDFLQEELDELKAAAESGSDTAADDIVDALIDLSVIAIGTLDLFKVDAQEAWRRVYEANMAKEVGVKASRPNPLNLPDLIKPEGWQAPSHADNVGLIPRALKK